MAAATLSMLRGSAAGGLTFDWYTASGVAHSFGLS